MVPPRAEWGCETDNQPTMHLSAVVQVWRFYLFDHTTWMPDETDANILIVPPWTTGEDHQDAVVPRGWETIQQDLNNLYVNEAIVM